MDAVATGNVRLRSGQSSLQLEFITDATGDMTKLDYAYTDNDDVYLLINCIDYDLIKFSSLGCIYIGTTCYGGFAYPYFCLLNTGNTVNDDFKQSLSFERIADPLFYQRTLQDTYWGVVDNILNDPVQLNRTGNIPEKVFKTLTPLSPVYLKTNETVNLYYCNRISGYKGAHKPCEVELIKLP